MQQTLTPEEFLAVVDKTPLVSIDGNVPLRGVKPEARMP
jgi:hypothetical protein